MLEDIFQFQEAYTAGATDAQFLLLKKQTKLNLSFPNALLAQVAALDAVICFIQPISIFMSILFVSFVLTIIVQMLGTSLFCCCFFWGGCPFLLYPLGHDVWFVMHNLLFRFSSAKNCVMLVAANAIHTNHFDLLACQSDLIVLHT